jgi:hypothetical protein
MCGTGIYKRDELVAILGWWQGLAEMAGVSGASHWTADQGRAHARQTEGSPRTTGAAGKDGEHGWGCCHWAVKRWNPYVSPATYLMYVHHPGATDRRYGRRGGGRLLPNERRAWREKRFASEVPAQHS